MAQAQGKIRSFRFYRWPSLPSIFPQLSLIREGNSQTAWIIKDVKWNLIMWRCVAVTPNIPRWVLEGVGEQRLLIGSKREMDFLLLSKVITNCRRIGRVIKVSWRCMNANTRAKEMTRWFPIYMLHDWKDSRKASKSSIQPRADFWKRCPPLDALICLLPFSPTPSLLSVPPETMNGTR